MDPRRFDELARRLAGALPRRSLIVGSTGAWLLAWLRLDEIVVGKRKRKRKPKSKTKSCTPNGKPCGKGKKLKPCSKCCSGFHITTRSKKKKCACRPDGARCTQNDQCCAELCAERHCGVLS